MTENADTVAEYKRMTQAFDVAQARYGKAAWVVRDPAAGSYAVKMPGTRGQTVIVLEAPTWAEFWKRLTGDLSLEPPRARPTRRSRR